jgi:hypothetical protein
MTGLKTQIILLIFIGIYIMNKIISSIPAILFIFILFMPHQSLAHDGEQHPENEHDSQNSHSESHEEGSGIRSYFKKHGDYQRKDVDKNHEYTTKHSEEGSGTVMKEKNSSDDQSHGTYENHEKTSEHKEEGSGTR